jgi:hypothetical protein
VAGTRTGRLPLVKGVAAVDLVDQTAKAEMMYMSTTTTTTTRKKEGKKVKEEAEPIR